MTFFLSKKNRRRKLKKRLALERKLIQKGKLKYNKMKPLNPINFLKRKMLKMNIYYYSEFMKHYRDLRKLNQFRYNYFLKEVSPKYKYMNNQNKLKLTLLPENKRKRKLVNLKNLNFFLNESKLRKLTKMRDDMRRDMIKGILKTMKKKKIEKNIEKKIKNKNNKKKKIIKSKIIKSKILYIFRIASHSRFRSLNARAARARFIRNRRRKCIKSYAAFSLPIHSFLSRIMFKSLESGLLFSALENSIAPKELAHPKEQFLSQKEAFFKFARRLRYRFNLNKEFKSAIFWSSKNNFLFNIHDRYKYFNHIKNFFKGKITRSSLIENFNSDVFKITLGAKYEKDSENKKGKNKKGKKKGVKREEDKKIKALFFFLKRMHSKSSANKILKKIVWHYYSQSIINHYRSSIFNNPVVFDHKYSLKWGKVNSFFYKQARSFRAHDMHKYNYIYFNISILRYLQLKSYINKIVKVFNIIIKKQFKPLYGLALSSFKKNLFFLVRQFTKISIHLHQYNDLYEDISYKKAEQSYNDRRMQFVASRLKLQYVKDLYLSFLKQTFIKYFKLNLHFKFERKNIFITVTNYRGDVKFRHSIGMLGYKKDKKKTYYASKELIRYTIPKLFEIFKIRSSIASQALKLSNTHLFNFYLRYLKQKNIDEEYWDYPSRLKKSLRQGLYKILYGTMKKYVTLRIILRGSKAKLRGLMRKVFKSLRVFKRENHKLVPRILFLALNTKPHNGCRSPKKGRRRTKRRRQKLRIRLLNKKFEYEQKYLKRVFLRRRYQLGIRKKGNKLPKIFSNNLLDKNYKRSLRYLKVQNRLSNLQNNFFPMKKYHFLYGGPRRKGAKHFEKYKKKYTRKQRIWKDFERWVNPIATKPKDFILKKKYGKRKPIFYNLHN